MLKVNGKVVIRYERVQFQASVAGKYRQLYNGHYIQWTRGLGTGDPRTRDPGNQDPGTQIGMHCACSLKPR